MSIERYKFKSFNDKEEEKLEQEQFEVKNELPEIQEEIIEEKPIIEPDILQSQKVNTEELDNLEKIDHEVNITNEQMLFILNNINQVIENSIKKNEEIVKNLTKNVSDLALIIAKKICLKSLSENPHKEIEIFLENSFKFFQEERNIEIYLNPVMIEVIKNKIEELYPNFVEKNNVIFKAENDYNTYDCNIIWKDGSLELNKNEIIKNIEQFF